MVDAILTRRAYARSRDDRLLAGVCGGLAARWRLGPAVVRTGAMALALCGGIGVAFYVGAWLMMPEAPAEAFDSVAPARVRNGDVVAAVVIIVGMMLVLRSIGIWFDDDAALIGLVAIVGVGLVWGRTQVGGSVTVLALRIAVGLALVVAGSIAFAGLWGDTAELARGVLAAVIVGAGIALLVGPYISRLSRELTAERRSRVRSEERAEIAAHLHDGVLQTLAVIQQRSGDQRLVSTLARRQERELREWLFGNPPAAGEETLASELRAMIADVEDTYGVRVELVTVGDRPLDADCRALLAALREATINAATHSGVAGFDVFVEAATDRVEAFVRDRGVGFDPEHVGTDRHGIRESIIGRMQRAGGTASVRSQPGDGTEVGLNLDGGGQ